MYEAVVTGLGVLAPNGIGKKMFWDAVTSGKTGINRIEELEKNSCPCQIAGSIPSDWVSHRSKTLPDWLPNSKTCKYSIIAAMLALEDAGLTPEHLATLNSEVYMGVSIPDMDVYQELFESFRAGGFADPAALVSGAIHAPATALSHIIKNYLRVITVSMACTSGSVSIDLAANSIIRGEADIAIAGGVEAPLSPVFMSGFSNSGLTPIDFNEMPEKASRPFDGKRQGGVLSEGAGTIIIEEKSKAMRRKAKIYASFAGGGLSTAMSPSWMKTSFYNAMNEALSKASLKPTDIDYISASAPGHPAIDQAEVEAIKELFKGQAYCVPISSIKSVIGNPGAAAGPMQVVMAVQSIEKNYIPPTVNLEQPGDGLDLDFVPNEGRVARVNRVMVNLRGLGGYTTSQIFSRPE